MKDHGSTEEEILNSGGIKNLLSQGGVGTYSFCKRWKRISRWHNNIRMILIEVWVSWTWPGYCELQTGKRACMREEGHPGQVGPHEGENVRIKVLGLIEHLFCASSFIANISYSDPQ